MKKLLAMLGVLAVASVVQANVWNIAFQIGWAYSPADGVTPVLDDYSVTWSLMDAATGKPLSALVNGEWVDATVRGTAGDSSIVFNDTAHDGGEGFYDNLLYADVGSFFYYGETSDASGSIYQYIELVGADGKYYWQGDTYQVATVDLATSAPGTPADVGMSVVIGTQSSSDTSVNAFWTKVDTVPEPATMSLLGLGALAMVLRRKVRK